MENKFHMTVEDNIFVAKRNIVDYIWKSAKMEGISITFPETDAVYNGINVSTLTVDDVIAVNNIKHGWQLVLEVTDYPMDYPFLCEINRRIGANLFNRAGFIRSIQVSVRLGELEWKPEMPIESQIKAEISDILRMEQPTERAITFMLYCMRKQMFLDGNKRTAMLAGNHIMVSNGCGIISIPIENQKEFSSLLMEYYQSNDMNTIKSFVYEKCIDGMKFDYKKDSPISNSRIDFEEMVQEFRKKNGSDIRTKIAEEIGVLPKKQ